MIRAEMLRRMYTKWLRSICRSVTPKQLRKDRTKKRRSSKKGLLIPVGRFVGGLFDVKGLLL